MNPAHHQIHQNLARYRSSTLQEKEALCRIPSIREELINRLSEYNQLGRMRRLSNEKLQATLLVLADPHSPSAVVVSHLTELRLPMEFWNELRQMTEKLSRSQREEWQQHHLDSSDYRNAILEHTAWLVPKIRQTHFRLDPQRVDDADGNGFIGLIKAIDHFDPNQGRSFESYAKCYILNHIMNFLRNDKLIRPSDFMRRFYKKYDQTLEDLRQELHRDPESWELASAMDLDLNELQEREQHRVSTLSMDADCGEEDDLNLHDLLGAEAALPYERMENQLLLNRLVHVLKRLNKTEAFIVALRWPTFQEAPWNGPSHPSPKAFAIMKETSMQRLADSLVT